MLVTNTVRASFLVFVAFLSLGFLIFFSSWTQACWWDANERSVSVARDEKEEQARTWWKSNQTRTRHVLLWVDFWSREIFGVLRPSNLYVYFFPWIYEIHSISPKFGAHTDILYLKNTETNERVQVFFCIIRRKARITFPRVYARAMCACIYMYECTYVCMMCGMVVRYIFARIKEWKLCSL